MTEARWTPDNDGASERKLPLIYNQKEKQGVIK
jgi:hypothetical protein